MSSCWGTGAVRILPDGVLPSGAVFQVWRGACLAEAPSGAEGEVEGISRSTGLTRKPNRTTTQIIMAKIILTQVSPVRKWQAEYQTQSRRINHLALASFRKSVDSARSTHRFPATRIAAGTKKSGGREICPPRFSDRSAPYCFGAGFFLGARFTGFFISPSRPPIKLIASAALKGNCRTDFSV